MATSFRVEADGSRSRLPLIGVVKLGDVCFNAAQKRLFEIYNADYFVNPQLSLQVLEFLPVRLMF